MYTFYFRQEILLPQKDYSVVFFVYMTNFILFKMRSCVAVLTAT